MQAGVVLLLSLLVASDSESSVLDYRIAGHAGQALVCRPAGKEPWPTVVYNHGLIVDLHGYQEAARRGYDLNGICAALASDGFFTFAPLRKSGPTNVPGHRAEVWRAIEYLKTLPEVDSSRLALMGFSRGGLLTLMVATERHDLRAVVIMAPAPGRGHFADAVRRVPSLNAPVLLLVEAGDDAEILEDYQLLERALGAHGKERRTIRYERSGGHRLFYQLGYYWDDVRAFLQEKLLRKPTP